MPEFISITARDVEQDCLDMTRLLESRGWVIVNGVIRSISAGIGLYNEVEPGAVSVFNPSQDAERWLPKYPGMASNTNIQMPHIMLARKTLRYGLLNSIQIAGGTITGINGYRLVEEH